MTKSPNTFRTLIRGLQWASVPVAVLIVVLFIRQRVHTQRELAARVQEHNSLKMEATTEHVAEYLDMLQMVLHFISLDDEVRELTRESHDYIQAIYEANYERHQLAEIYVIERSFDGTARPFMTFEHSDEGHCVEGVHSLEQEAEEYQV
ncbi:hypothetical protein LCGC14_2285090, partial [marine sediment metagenome]